MTKQLIDYVRNGDTESVKRLIDDGSDINTKHEYGRTPLHIAISDGRVDVAHLLIDSGADINMLSDDNTDPLNLAAWYGLDSIVKKLIELE